jgi:CheY-like chemotaxis protein
MKTILQVEDDPNDVFFLQRAMKKAGVLNPIQVARDGQEAIDYLRGAGEFADRDTFPFPCLVLLDLKLPQVMGLDVLRWIRSQPEMWVPVVVMSASSEDSDMMEAYRLGCNGFLIKPSESSKLESVAGAITHFWLTHNALPNESGRERGEALAGSKTGAPNRDRLPAETGARHWHPGMVPLCPSGKSLAL